MFTPNVLTILFLYFIDCSIIIFISVDNSIALLYAVNNPSWSALVRLFGNPEYYASSLASNPNTSLVDVSSLSFEASDLTNSLAVNYQQSVVYVGSDKTGNLGYGWLIYDELTWFMAPPVIHQVIITNVYSECRHDVQNM
jgi:hypothetical protein